MDTLNPLDSKGNYSATSNNTKLVHWPLLGGYIWYSEEAHWAGCGPTQSLHATQSTSKFPHYY